MKTLSVILTISLFSFLNFGLSKFIESDVSYNEIYQANEDLINTQNYTPVRVNFYTNTTQQEVDNAVETLNPMNYFRCVDDPDVYIMMLSNTIIGDGRGNASGGNGDSDNVIDSITSIRSYRVNGICD